MSKTRPPLKDLEHWPKPNFYKSFTGLKDKILKAFDCGGISVRFKQNSTFSSSLKNSLPWIEKTTKKEQELGFKSKQRAVSVDVQNLKKAGCLNEAAACS